MEREIIVERVKEGIEKAKEYGTKSRIPIGSPGIRYLKISKSIIKNGNPSRLSALSLQE